MSSAISAGVKRSVRTPRAISEGSRASRSAWTAFWRTFELDPFQPEQFEQLQPGLPLVAFEPVEQLFEFGVGDLGAGLLRHEPPPRRGAGRRRRSSSPVAGSRRDHLDPTEEEVLLLPAEDFLARLLHGVERVPVDPRLRLEHARLEVDPGRVDRLLG